jgi:hypothetical protein
MAQAVSGRAMAQAVSAPCHGSGGQCAVPWLRRSVAGLSHWRFRFNPRPVHERCVTKWHWDRFLSQYFSFPCQYHSIIALYHLHLIRRTSGQSVGTLKQGQCSFECWRTLNKTGTALCPHLDLADGPSPISMLIRTHNYVVPKHAPSGSVR